MGDKSEDNTTSLFNNVALILYHKAALSQLHRGIIRSNAREAIELQAYPTQGLAPQLLRHT